MGPHASSSFSPGSPVSSTHVSPSQGPTPSGPFPCAPARSVFSLPLLPLSSLLTFTLQLDLGLHSLPPAYPIPSQKLLCCQKPPGLRSGSGKDRGRHLAWKYSHLGFMLLRKDASRGSCTGTDTGSMAQLGGNGLATIPSMPPQAQVPPPYASRLAGDWEESSRG